MSSLAYNSPLPRIHSADAVATTRWHFAGICLYILSQAYLIPLRAIGPSWAVWPTLADIAVCIVVLSCCWQLPGMDQLQPASRRLLAAITGLCAYCAVSFAILSVLVSSFDLYQPASHDAILWGGYQFVRLTQFLIIFYVASAIPLTGKRLRWLTGVASVTLLFASLSIFAAYLSSAIRHLVVAHLPTTKSSGPWFMYESSHDGLGTLSYNHGDCAAQVLMMFGLVAFLRRGKYDLASACLMFLSLAAIFLTGSRTLLIAALVLAFVYTLMSVHAGRIGWILSLAIAGLVAALALSISDSDWGRKFQTENARLIERQVGEIAQGRTNNLSGRLQIWRSRIRYLNERPGRWIFGCGFGSSTVIGKHKFGHNLPLTIVTELGLIGLAASGALMVLLLRLLWRYESGERIIFWLTVALLITCAARDTFYPIPHTAHFIGFFLLTVALALRASEANTLASAAH